MQTAGPSPWQTTSQAVSPSAIPDHELLCLIGRGAYGEVWMARNAIGTLRAVKIVHRQSFQRVEHFEREFKGLLKFEPMSRSHDGFVDILQIGRRDDAGYFFYVMELADTVQLQSLGTPANETESVSLPCPTPQLVSPSSIAAYMPRTLRSELHQRGSLPVAECVGVGAKLAAALQHLHGSGLVHRDIKPSNIIFVKGEPKLADIGLVTEIDDAHSLVGTAGYIPPEGPGTLQADLYSLGKVLYEIAFGKDRQDFPQLPADLQSRPDYAALLELNEVILKSCETDPSKRYASANDLERDLALLQKGVSVRQNRKREKHWAVAKKGILAGITVGFVIAALLVFQSFGREYKPKPEAARLYEDGRWHYSQLTPEDHGKAYDLLNKAVQVDPKFVRPYGELMALYTWYLLPRPEYSEEARYRETKEIADRALAIDPDAAEGYTALSWCKFLKRDWQGAEAEIRRAIKLNPDLAIAHNVYSFLLSMQGRTEQARQEGQRAQELEPPGPKRIAAIIAAWPFMVERRFDLAIAQLQRSLTLDTNFTYGHAFLADCYDAQTNYAYAINEFELFATLRRQDPARITASFGALRQAYKTDGDEGYLRTWIDLIVADRAMPEQQQLFIENDLPGYYARLGNKEKALEELEKHFHEPQNWHQIKFKALYDSLYDEPRFKELVRRAGLKP